MSKRILICSTPVGPLGSGLGGGVETTLSGLVAGLSGRGHRVEVAAQEGSIEVAGAILHRIAGAAQPIAQTHGREAPIAMPPSSVLAATWEWVRRVQDDYDVVVNLAYDWLPMFLTPFLRTPVAHLVSMASVSDAMDGALAALAAARPEALAAHTRAQAATFPAPADRMAVLGNGLEVERYEYREHPDEPAYLGFVGRIAPEKGIADLFAVAERVGMRVKVWGLMQDRACWDDARRAHPAARVDHAGFLTADELRHEVGGAAAVLMPTKWVEAFGNVAVEANACGVPVLAYRRGGPVETITDGVSGILVPPDDVAAMAAAVPHALRLDRAACRREAEARHSLPAFAARVDEWLDVNIDRWGPGAGVAA